MCDKVKAMTYKTSSINELQTFCQQSFIHKTWVDPKKTWKDAGGSWSQESEANKWNDEKKSQQMKRHWERKGSANPYKHRKARKIPIQYNNNGDTHENSTILTYVKSMKSQSISVIPTVPIEYPSSRHVNWK